MLEEELDDDFGSVLIGLNNLLGLLGASLGMAINSRKVRFFTGTVVKLGGRKLLLDSHSDFHSDGCSRSLFSTSSGGPVSKNGLASVQSSKHIKRGMVPPAILGGFL